MCVVGSGVEVTVSSASGADVQYEHPSAERLPNLLNVIDGGIEAGSSSSASGCNTTSSTIGGVNSAPSTPETHRQDRGFIIHSPISIVGSMSGESFSEIVPTI